MSEGVLPGINETTPISPHLSHRYSKPSYGTLFLSCPYFNLHPTPTLLHGNALSVADATSPSLAKDNPLTTFHQFETCMLLQENSRHHYLMRTMLSAPRYQ